MDIQLTLVVPSAPAAASRQTYNPKGAVVTVRKRVGFKEAEQEVTK